MRLEPLRQWRCDTCGDIIERPRHGFLGWRQDQGGRAAEFLIFHNGNAPRSMGDALCDPGREFTKTCPIEDVLGARGMAKMLSFIDYGEIVDPEARHLLRVSDLRNWTETFRRLFIPHYEQARRHFASANADGLFDGAGEVNPYTEDFLQGVIERYDRGE